MRLPSPPIPLSRLEAVLERVLVPTTGTNALDGRAHDFGRVVGLVASAAVGFFLPALVLAQVPIEWWLPFMLAASTAGLVIGGSFILIPRRSRWSIPAAVANALFVGRAGAAVLPILQRPHAALRIDRRCPRGDPRTAPGTGGGGARRRGRAVRHPDRRADQPQRSLHVPDELLTKPGRLNAEEWAIVQRHTIWGERILGNSAGFELARRICRSHHENWDGSGYPDRLRGEQIALPARIVRLADAFDAMRNPRPYKDGWPLERCLDIIERGAGSLFDPELAAELLAIYGVTTPAAARLVSAVEEHLPTRRRGSITAHA